MTHDKKTIFLYGNSVLMTGVEVTLRANPELKIIYINPAHPGAQEQWAAISDGILIYDRGATAPQMVQAFSASHPDVSMVSLDATENTMRVYAHRRHQAYIAQGMTDLVRLIETLDK